MADCYFVGLAFLFVLYLSKKCINITGNQDIVLNNYAGKLKINL